MISLPHITCTSANKMDKDRSHTERNGKSLVKENPVPPPGISMFVCCTFMTVYPAGLFDGDILQTASAWLTYTYNTHTKDLYIPHNHSLKIPPPSQLLQ